LVERESKSCKHLSQTPNVFTPLQGMKHVIPPIWFDWFEAKKLRCYYYLHEALFDQVFDLVLEYCFFLKPGIIDYPTTVVALTQIILFSEMLKISFKKILIKEKL
jgi:hypothetical protein